MADVAKLVPKILKWEGGAIYTNDPVDPGGPTKYGVTIGAWQQMGYDKDGDGDIDADDIKKLAKEDFQFVLKVGYWDRWKADSIKNQSVANILVDWVWGSGAWGIKIPQRVLGLKEDGIVGPATISKINAMDQKILHAKIHAARIEFVDKTVRNSILKLEASLSRPATQEEKEHSTLMRFEKGWKNRINDYQFEP